MSLHGEETGNRAAGARTRRQTLPGLEQLQMAESLTAAARARLSCRLSSCGQGMPAPAAMEAAAAAAAALAGGGVLRPPPPYGWKAEFLQHMGQDPGFSENSRVSIFAWGDVPSRGRHPACVRGGRSAHAVPGTVTIA